MRPSSKFLHRVHELYLSFIKFDASQANRDSRYRNIEPESAHYLAMQIRIQQSKNILEIGTSTGYSTLWLAQAAQMTGAQVTTLEIDPKRTKLAQQYAKELALDHLIEFWVGDAKDFLATAQQQYDFILLDAERHAYIDYWTCLQRILHPKGGVLIVDNVISHAAEVKNFIEVVKQDLRFMSTTIALGAGLFVVVYQG